ncbi:hypothetical protein HYY74_06825 [Candidatus Woesearchaeota archaeon]|nr:hypothetical protein [Candidatus Woesearchaeota archaeon]
MSKGAAAIILVFAAIAIAGCGQQSAPDTRSGTRGLEMSFIQGNPPDRFIVPGEMGISLQIKNTGWATAEGNVYLSGFDPSVLSDLRNPNGAGIPYDGLGIRGKSVGDSQGEIAWKDFKVNARLSDEVDVYRTRILATACYNYETIASTMVCVDPTPFGVTERQKVCTSAPVSLSSQGAPVAVTRIEPSNAAGKIRFTIHVQNVGPGLVYQVDHEDGCQPYGPGLKFEELNQIRVESVTIGGQPCNVDLGNNEGFIKLIDGRKSFLCTYSIPGGQNAAFNSPIIIRLRYGYRDSVSKDLEIAKIPR